VHDGSRDAFVEASLDAGVDAAAVLTVCYVYDDCNSGNNNDYSASGCPMTAPTIGSECRLASGRCFYCAPDQDAWHWHDSSPEYTCQDGRWATSDVYYACE
jgi:hypothetical protein